MDKILDLLGSLMLIICIGMLTLFTILCVMLYRFKECKEQEFESPYCEKYRDF